MDFNNECICLEVQGFYSFLFKALGFSQGFRVLELFCGLRV